MTLAMFWAEVNIYVKLVELLDQAHNVKTPKYIRDRFCTSELVTESY